MKCTYPLLGPLSFSIKISMKICVRRCNKQIFSSKDKNLFNSLFFFGECLKRKERKKGKEEGLMDERMKEVTKHVGVAKYILAILAMR